MRYWALIARHGAYGARMVEMAGLEVSPITPHDCGEASARRTAGDRRDPQRRPDDQPYIAMVHSETTTGMLNPLMRWAPGASLWQKNPTSLSDAMSSFAASPWILQHYTSII